MKSDQRSQQTKELLIHWESRLKILTPMVNIMATYPPLAKELDIDDKLQDIKEKERNLDNLILEKSQEKVDLDQKYKDLQDKINADIKEVSKREKELESKLKENIPESPLD